MGLVKQILEFYEAVDDWCKVQPDVSNGIILGSVLLNLMSITKRLSLACGNARGFQAARLTTMGMTVWGSSKMARINIGVRMTLVCGKK